MEIIKSYITLNLILFTWLMFAIVGANERPYPKMECHKGYQPGKGYYEDGAELKSSEGCVHFVKRNNEICEGGINKEDVCFKSCVLRETGALEVFEKKEDPAFLWQCFDNNENKLKFAHKVQLRCSREYEAHHEKPCMEWTTIIECIDQVLNCKKG